MKVQIVLILSLFLLIGCRKQEITVPEEEELKSEPMKKGIVNKCDSIHGYLTAYQQFQLPNNNIIYQYNAYFGDPARNLLSNYNRFENYSYAPEEQDRANLKLGSVQFNSTTLSWFAGQVSSYNYYQNNSTKIKINPEWKVQGNKTFTGFTVNVDRGFPVIKDSTTITTHSLSTNSMIFDLSDHFENCDSMMVWITQSSGYYIPMIRRIVHSSQPVVTFSDIELSNLQAGYIYSLKFKAYNYSYFMKDNKRYVFEMGTGFERNFNVVQ